MLKFRSIIKHFFIIILIKTGYNVVAVVGNYTKRQFLNELIYYYNMLQAIGKL